MTNFNLVDLVPFYFSSNNTNTGVFNDTSEKYSIITDAVSIETNLSNVSHDVVVILVCCPRAGIIDRVLY